MGFDGYVDEIFRVVKERVPGKAPVYYGDMAEFGRKIVEAAGKNTELELVRQKEGLGGNGPLMAGCLADLGCQVTCMGLFGGECEAGGPSREAGAFGRLFLPLQEKCRCVSIGDANHCSALEFGNGKVMLGSLNGSGLTWEELKRQTGLKWLIEMVRECALMGITNWSAFHSMNDILVGFKTEVFPYCALESHGAGGLIGERKILFFDLSDLSAKSPGECRLLGELLRRFQDSFNVVLSLNKNESCLLAEKLLGRRESCENAGRLLRDHLEIHMTVLHTREKSCCFMDGETARERTAVISEPLISTGAGDHFNGAFCGALLMGKTPKEALQWGNGAASFYMRKGRGPDGEELLVEIYKNWSL